MLFSKNKSVYDYLVVGLGNKGKEYISTRHNAGFEVADRLIRKWSATGGKLKCRAEVFDVRLDGRRILIAKPQTYMNLSGEAVAELCKFYKIPTAAIIAVFDDISLPVGKLRIRKNGSHGGHNGLKNISECLGTTDIVRVKVGVGEKPHPQYDLKDWVLGKFSSEDAEIMADSYNKAAEATEAIIKLGADKAMSKFNG